MLSVTSAFNCLQRSEDRKYRQLWAAHWVLGTELRSPVRIANSLNLGVISPASWFVGVYCFMFLKQALLSQAGLELRLLLPFFFFPNCLLDHKCASKHMVPLPVFCLFLTKSGVMLWMIWLHLIRSFKLKRLFKLHFYLSSLTVRGCGGCAYNPSLWERVVGGSGIQGNWQHLTSLGPAR